MARILSRQILNTNSSSDKKFNNSLKDKLARLDTFTKMTILFVALFSLASFGSFLMYQHNLYFGKQVNATGNALQDTKALTLQLFELQQQRQPSQKALPSADMLTTLFERKKALLQLIEENPKAAAQFALSPSFKNQLPQSLQSYIEEEVTLEGTMKVLHIHYSDTSSKTLYTLSTKDRGDISVFFSDTDETPLTGDTVRIRGMLLDKKLVPNKTHGKPLEILQTGKRVLGVATRNIRKFAVILYNLQDSPTQPITPAQAGGVMFTNTNSAKQYWQEASFGQLSIQGKYNQAGDVFGWVTIPYSYDSSCPWSTWDDAAKQAVTAQGYDLTGYDDIIFTHPQINGCPAGVGWVGGPGADINDAANLWNVHTIAHEVGHNFGLSHSSGDDCTLNGQRVTLSSSCTVQEYGDPFDPMGGTYPNIASNHYNMFDKGRLSWLQTGNTTTVSASGTYTIAPLEKSASGTQVIRIPRTVDSNNVVTSYFYLDYRQPYGFDSFSPSDPAVNGVEIRIAPSYGIGQNPLLLDTTPSTTTYNDAPLLVGQTFTDSQTGISIQTVSTSATGAVVTITTPALLQPLPSPWQDLDIGNVNYPGGVKYASGSFTVTGSGGDIWYSSDQFHFVYQPFSGDGQIIARIASEQASDSWAKIGVMIRDNLYADSAHAMMLITPGNQASFERRTVAGGSTTQNVMTGVVPGWIKLTRSGNTLQGYYSTDGKTWQLVGSDTIQMGTNISVGLAVSAHNSSLTATGVFDNVSITSTTPPSGSGTGLQGVYYDNMDFTGTSITRTDPTVNFSWGQGSPDPAIGPDTFSARWNGVVVPQYTETYTFYTNTDDGVRLWVNNQLLVDKWVDQSATQWSGTITLTAGQQYPIKMEYYENGVDATAQLFWSSPSTPKQIIPQSQLFLTVAQPTGTVTPIPSATPTPTLPLAVSPTPTPIVSGDTTPPTVSITNPLNNSTVTRNSTITISANASDNVGVAKVEFLVNGTLIGTAATPPYSTSWSVGGKPKATYTITARASDAQGNTSSNAVKVTSSR